MTATLTTPPVLNVSAAAARAVGATKRYGAGDAAVTALDAVTVDFQAHQFTAIMGPSGSGKSTLMHLVAGLDTLTSGSVFIGDTDLSGLDDRRLTLLRRDKIGFIFQAFNLVPTLTALENITLPTALAGRKPDKEWVDKVVTTVGLQNRLGHRPSELSGGQQQRVAVARALASRPSIIFGDEPTGNLDSRTGAEILSFMRGAVRDLGQTIVMVTHDPAAASYAERVIFLADGSIVDEMFAPTPDRVLDRMKHFGGVIAMFRTTLKTLAARKLRLFTTSFAVLLGVAFMAGTLVLTDTIGKTFDKLFADANSGTDAYVRAEAAFDSEWFGEQRPHLDATLVDAINHVDGVAVAEGHIEAYAQLVDKAGKPIGNPNMGAPVLGSEWLSSDDLNPFDLSSGRAPHADNEVVIDKGSADSAGFVAGDTTTVLTQAGPQTVTIVGIARFGDTDSPGGASFTMFTPTAAQAFLTHPGKIDAIKIVGEPGVSQAQLVVNISKVVPSGTEVLTGAQITAEEQASIKDDMSFFNVFLMVFAIIALFVGSFIIYNSFSILVAQRTKEMALMRAIGASRRQVTRSVLFEACVVGFIASALGLAAGVGVAAGLKALLAGIGIDIPAGGVVLTTKTVIVSFIAGMGVSVASAVFPARRAAKVPPIAAMRDVAVDQSSRSRRRVINGSIVTGLGALAMGAGLFGGAGIAPVGAGAVLVFVGVAVLGPVLARPISRVIGSPLPRLKGMSGTLARQNAMRNPKRTSATAAALMIGVALVGFITILASSTKASVAANVDKTFNGDLVVSSNVGGAGGLSPSLASELSALPQLDAVTGLRMAPAEVDGSGTNLLSAEPHSMQQINDFGTVEGSLGDLHAGEIAVLKDVADEKGWKLGQQIPVRFAETGTKQLTMVATFTEGATIGDYFIGLEAYDANISDTFDRQVLMTVADGTSVEDARAAVAKAAAAYPQGEVQDRDQYRKAQTKNLDMLLNLIYALLALAVFIALLGIANTLALSIFERTRELGLLRAVGMTRGQLRATVRYESVIIALLGTTLGLGIGTAFGWSIVKALKEEGLDTFAFPASQLAVVTVIAALAGVAAAALPARRAARLNVLAAITAD